MTSSMSKRLTIESYVDFVAVAVVARTGTSGKLLRNCPSSANAIRNLSPLVYRSKMM